MVAEKKNLNVRHTAMAKLIYGREASEEDCSRCFEAPYAVEITEDSLKASWEIPSQTFFACDIYI